MTNLGAEVGGYDMFSLMGVSPCCPRAALPQPGELRRRRPEGVRRALRRQLRRHRRLPVFAISTYGRRPHLLYPRGLEVDVDTGAGGLYYIYQEEVGGFGASGQSACGPRARRGQHEDRLYNDADLNSGNTIFTVPMAALASVAPVPATLTIDVYAYDNYFTGNLSDAITGMKSTPGRRFARPLTPAPCRAAITKILHAERCSDRCAEFGKRLLDDVPPQCRLRGPGADDQPDPRRPATSGHRRRAARKRAALCFLQRPLPSACRRAGQRRAGAPGLGTDPAAAPAGVGQLARAVADDQPPAWTSAPARTMTPGTGSPASRRST
ncbi:MAG: hypothetical protein U1F49_07800 [Rubrivivax sp.]